MTPFLFLFVSSFHLFIYLWVFAQFVGCLIERGGSAMSENNRNAFNFCELNKKHNEKQRRTHTERNFSSATQKIHKCMMLSILIGFDFLFAYTFSCKRRDWKLRFSSRWKVAVCMCVRAIAYLCSWDVTRHCRDNHMHYAHIVCSERAKQTRQLTESFFVISVFFFPGTLFWCLIFIDTKWMESHAHLNDGDGDPTFESKRNNKQPKIAARCLH